MLSILKTLVIIGFVSSLSACAGGAGLARYAAFSEADIPATANFRSPVTAPTLVVGLSSGIVSVDILSQKGAEREFVKGGGGEPLPVSVYIDLPAQTSDGIREVHRGLKLDGDYKFIGVATDAVNRDVALALAKEVLAKTYCRGGAVTENHDAQVVDTKGSEPVLRKFPMISSSPPDGKYIPGWTVKLLCGLWTKAT